MGQGDSLDGTRTNPWYGLFPQEWLDGGEEGAGGAEQAGAAWERRRKQLQRLGDCCLRLCADMWSMACFLWTTVDRTEPAKERSKRGRAWARKAEEMLAANPAQMAKEISIYRMSWLSKRQSVYAPVFLLDGWREWRYLSVFCGGHALGTAFNQLVRSRAKLLLLE